MSSNLVTSSNGNTFVLIFFGLLGLLVIWAIIFVLFDLLIRLFKMCFCSTKNDDKKTNENGNQLIYMKFIYDR